MNARAPEIETRRLRLRMFTREDLDEFVAIRSDPEVMRYIGTGQPNSREHVQAALSKNERSWEEHGFGRWAVIHREHHKLIGWCGLSFLDTTRKIEIGYGLARSYWRLGLTAEAATACFRYAFEKLRLECIAAVALPENIASRRVMEKAGMRFVGRARHYEADVIYYEIRRENFRPDDSPYKLVS